MDNRIKVKQNNNLYSLTTYNSKIVRIQELIDLVSFFVALKRMHQGERRMKKDKDF